MTAPADALEGAVRDAGQWVAGVAAEVGGSSWLVGAAVAAAGLLLLLAGARARRPVAVLGAAGVSALAMQAFLLRGGSVPGVATTVLPVAAAAVGAALAALVPPVFPALAGALPLALLGDLVAPAGHRLEAVGVGALVGVVLGLLAARLVASAVASCAGALAVAIGVAGAVRGTGVGRALAAHPAAILAAVSILAVAGTAFQYARAWGRGAAAPKGKGPAPLQGPDGKPA